MSTAKEDYHLWIKEYEENKNNEKQENDKEELMSMAWFFARDEFIDNKEKELEEDNKLFWNIIARYGHIYR